MLSTNIQEGELSLLFWYKTVNELHVIYVYLFRGKPPYCSEIIPDSHFSEQENFLLKPLTLQTGEEHTAPILDMAANAHSNRITLALHM